MNIRELNVNDRGTFTMLLESVSQKIGKNGGPYCVLTLKPSMRDASVEARMWNCDRTSVIATTPEMSVVDVAVTCGEYNGAKNYVADSMIVNTRVDRRTFIEESEIRGDIMYNYVVKGAESTCFAGRPERDILMKLYNEHQSRLTVWPAAVNVHHNYIGGLMMHSGIVARGTTLFFKTLSPKIVSSVMDVDAGKVVDGLAGLINKHSFSDRAAALIGGYFGKSLTAAPVAVKRKYLVANFVCALETTYRFLNRDILFTALLYRDVHNLTADPLAQVIGSAPADVRTFKKDLRAFGFGEDEFSRMVEHCLLVDMGNAIKPVIPEAFFLLYAEKLADLAIRNAGNEQLDICTAYIGAALHDIGKVAEYNSDEFGKAEFSTDGRLFGHSMIGVDMIISCADELGIDPVSINKLLNCVASHHDKKEWGALTAPVCQEAEIVATMDYIDSHMDIYRRRAEASEPGEFNDDSLRLAGVRVYRPDFQKPVQNARI